MLQVCDVRRLTCSRRAALHTNALVIVSQPIPSLHPTVKVTPTLVQSYRPIANTNIPHWNTSVGQSMGPCFICYLLAQPYGVCRRLTACWLAGWSGLMSVLAMGAYWIFNSAHSHNERCQNNIGFILNAGHCINEWPPIPTNSRNAKLKQIV